MLYRVPLVFTPQPEGGYTVTSPVLPELITEGDTLEEAHANVRDAFEAVVELYTEQGRPLPALLTLPAAGEVLDAVRVELVRLDEPRGRLPRRERGEERARLDADGLHDLLVRPDALRDHLAESRVVLVQHVLDARVVPDRVRELAAHELEVRQ